MAWDLLDEDCSDISDWTDADVGTGVSQVNPAGQFEFASPGTGVANRAQRTRDIGSFPNTFTIEIKLYHDAIGTKANIDHFYCIFNQADEYLYVKFATDGIFINDTGSGDTEVGTNLVVSAMWQTWRFLVTFGTVGNGVCDVYLNDTTHNWTKVGNAIPCSTQATVTDGVIDILQWAGTTANRLTHIDWIKIMTGLDIPIAEGSAVFFGCNF